MPSSLGKSLLLRALQGLVVGVLQLLFFVILVPVSLLVKLWEWLTELFKRGNLYPESAKDPCPALPEAVVRRPDPCIYSQTLLAAQGLPFTYKNPDIWIVDPNNPSTLNPGLRQNTEYIVNVRVHNASLDPAIGVRVGLASVGPILNSPGYQPAERDPRGREIFRFANVPGMSSAVVQFRWTSPDVPEPAPGDTNILLSGLQARLRHPMDTNTANNVGRHNYSVTSSNPGHVLPGQVLNFSVPLNNPSPRPALFRFEANIYDVDSQEKVTLRLRRARGRARWSLARRLYNLRPTLHGRAPSPLIRQARGPGFGRFDFQGRARLQLVKAHYEGFEPVRQALLSQDYSLPSGMDAAPVGYEGDALIELAPGETRPIPFRVRVSEDAHPGSQMSLNLICRSERGALMGGFTLLLNVRTEVE